VGAQEPILAGVNGISSANRDEKHRFGSKKDGAESQASANFEPKRKKDGRPTEDSRVNTT